MPNSLTTVVGLEDVIKMLDTAPRVVVAHGFLKALQAGADVIANELEMRTPIKKEDTGGLLDRGVLRESVMILVTLDSQFRGGQAQVGFGRNGVVANFVEYGHRLVGHKPGKKVLGQVPMNPLMRTTADLTANAAIAAFTSSLEQTVKNQFPQGKP